MILMIARSVILAGEQKHNVIRKNSVMYLGSINLTHLTSDLKPKQFKGASEFHRVDL